MRLRIIRLKPNPAGKDRPRRGSLSPTQLAGEWVDFRNDTGCPVTLAGVALYHRAHRPDGTYSMRRIMGFTGTVPSGAVVRVHAGKPRGPSVIREDDLAGATHHVFTGTDAFIWNNAECDEPVLCCEGGRQTTIDAVSYAAHPAEGAVLVRQGTLLSPVLPART